MFSSAVRVFLYGSDQQSQAILPLHTEQFRHAQGREVLNMSNTM
jgi:hypothetical protein